MRALVTAGCCRSCSTPQIVRRGSKLLSNWRRNGALRGNLPFRATLRDPRKNLEELQGVFSSRDKWPETDSKLLFRKERSVLRKSLSVLRSPNDAQLRASANEGNSVFQVTDESEFEEGPVELPSKEEMDPFEIPEANPAQIVASFVLTGTIGVLLLRSFRRRVQRAKDLKFRSSGAQAVKSVQEEARKSAIDNLKKAPEVPTPPPSAVQTVFGAVVAGVIAFGLYKFATTVEGGFSGKAVSTNYSIRNLTITIRTIINGLLYLATFVFAANSIGLALYSIQLFWGADPLPDPPAPSETVETQEPSSELNPEKTLGVEDNSKL